MRTLPIKLLFLLFTLLGFAFLLPKTASAYSCTGTIRCIKAETVPPQYKNVSCSGVGSCTASCGAGWYFYSGSCSGCATSGEFGNCCSGLGVCANGRCGTKVNGGWSAWSPGTCPASCTQTRTCTNPVPSCGGTGCPGSSSRTCTGGACQPAPTNNPSGPSCSGPYSCAAGTLVPPDVNACASVCGPVSVGNPPQQYQCATTERLCHYSCTLNGSTVACNNTCMYSTSCTNTSCGPILQGTGVGSCGSCSPAYGINQYSCCSGCRKYLGYRVCHNADGSAYNAAECSQPDPACGTDCGGAPPSGTCNTTAPTNVSITPLTSQSATINWTPGANGTKQMLFGGNDKILVEAGCPYGTGSGCSVVQNNLSTSTSTYNTGAVLSAGTVYFWRVVNFKDSGCSSASTTARSVSSCTLSSGSLTMQIGDIQDVTVSLSSSTEISGVSFTAGSGAISLNPTSDTTYIYGTTITANSSTSPGFSSVTSDVYLTGLATPACTDALPVFVNPRGPWWQVVDSDVSSNGDLTDGVPSGSYFDLAGDGGFPGVPAYSGTTDLGSTNVSATGWLANSPSLGLSARYDSGYFFNQIPGDTVITDVSSNSVEGSEFESGGVESYGYYWYQYDGGASGLDLTLNSAINLGSRKVILLVKSADFYINGPINLTDGQGFFMVVVGKNIGGTKGNINVDPTIGGTATPTLEGLFAADGIFSTGAGSTQLWVRGTASGIDGVAMQRDLGDGENPTTPAELFEYAPDLILLYPPKLSARRINWKEVAP